ncbi:MAG: 50S ribosomal protein L13 [Firmicutes bacterium]|nr:50S ribosomal protein L13 [Bacillota bacterium]
MKTYMPKGTDFNEKDGSYKRKWFVVDAEGMVLGRLATVVASILRGKNKPIFTPNIDAGDFVIVVNCDKIVLTGKKMEQKFYTYHTGYVGGLKQVPYSKLIKTKPEFVVQRAVKGMLPKNTLGKDMFAKLFTYAGAEHKHQAQKPEELKLK